MSSVDWEVLRRQLTAQLEQAGVDDFHKLDVGQVLILTRLDSMAKQDGRHTEAIGRLENEVQLLKVDLAALRSEHDAIQRHAGSSGAKAGGLSGVVTAILTKIVGG